MDLVAADRTSPAADIDDPRDIAELALEHPVLERFEIVERINLVARGILRRL